MALLLGADPEEVQNTSILDLLDIADEYDLVDLIKMPELTIDSQDENGEYLSSRVVLPWFVGIWFYLWFGSCFARYDRTGKRGTGASAFCIKC